MAQPLLETEEQAFLVAGLYVNDPSRGKARLCKRRREQIGPGQAPEHLPPGSRGDTGGKEHGGRPLDSIVPTPAHFVEARKRKPAAGQPVVDLRHTEGQHCPFALRTAVELSYTVTQAGDDSAGSGG